MSDARINIYVLGCADTDPRLSAMRGANWNFILCNELPAAPTENSLLLLFVASNSQHSLDWLAQTKNFPRDRIRLVIDNEQAGERRLGLQWQQHAPWLKEITPQTRALEEAWSQVLRSQLKICVDEYRQSKQATTNPESLALAFVASGLAQSMSRDICQVRQAILLALRHDPMVAERHAIWSSNADLASVIVATADLVLAFQEKSAEEFRTSLREKSAQLPFKLRSELRLITEHCFASLWRSTNVA